MKLLLRIYILGFAVMLSGSVLNAQEPYYSNFTVKDGLPTNYVYHTMQDSRGYLWFSTEEGVCKFDGVNFVTYTTSDGLADNEIFECVEDSKGRIWFMSFSGELSYLQNDSFHNPWNDPFLAQIPVYQYHEQLFEDSKGNIWVMDKIGKLIRLSADLTSYASIEPNGVINVIYENERNQIVVTNRMLLDTVQNDTIETVFSNWGVQFKGKSKVPFSHPVRNVWHFWGRHKDNIYLAFNNHVVRTKEGVTSLNVQEKDIFKTDKIITYIGSDDQDNLWIATHDEAILIPNGDFDSQNIRSFLKGQKIHHVFQDREGNYWFCTRDQGVFYCPALDVNSIHEENGLLEREMMSVLKSREGGVYFGGKERSITYIDESEKVRFVDLSRVFPSSIEVYTMLEDAESKLLIGGNCGLVELSGLKNRTNSFQFERLQFFGKVIKIKKAIEGGYWVGTNSGLVRTRSLEKRSEDSSFKRESDFFLIKERILAIEPYKEDSLWVAVHGELLLGDTTGFRSIDELKPHIQNSRITKFITNPSGSLWISTFGNGVLLYSPGNIQKITKKEGLAGNICNSMYRDQNGVLWVATNKGVSRIVLESDFPLKYKITNFDTRDGLIADRINDVMYNKGTVYVATPDGISWFKEDMKINKSHVEPLMHITGVKIANQPVNLASSFSLDHTSNSIAIDYIGLSFRSQGDVRYRYRLVGLDEEWHYTRSRSIEYPALPPGDYTLQMGCQGINDVWSTNNAEIRFVIASPYWRKASFVFFIIMLILIGIASVVYKIMRDTNRRNDFQNRILFSEQKALRAQMNPHFIFNSMSSIQRYVLENQSAEAVEYLGEFGALIRQILENSKRNVINLTDEIYFLKMYLYVESMRFKDKFDFKIHCSSDLDLHNTYIPSMLIQPFVENAIWHGISSIDRRGDIHLEFENSQDQLICRIKDNGIGITKASNEPTSERKHLSRGMEIIRERISLINQGKAFHIEIHIQDVLKGKDQVEGTCVELVFSFIEGYEESFLKKNSDALSV